MMRGIGLILITALGSALALAGSSGYLARVGPSAIRFRQPVERAGLPPVAVEPEARAVEPEAPPAGTPFAEGVATVSTEPELPQTQAAASEPVARIAPVETNDNISPEVLLPFFRPSAMPTNRSVLVPPAFTPARPADSSGSSATYVSPSR